MQPGDVSVLLLVFFSPLHHSDSSISEIHSAPYQSSNILLFTASIFTHHHFLQLVWSLRKHIKEVIERVWIVFNFWVRRAKAKKKNVFFFCRCFGPADKYSSEEEHLCGNSLLDGSWGTVKLASTSSHNLFSFYYISLEQIPVGHS